VKLRTARLADRPALAALAREAFPWTMKFGLAPRWIVRWYWDAVLASDSCEVWIAEQQDRVVGFAVLVTDPAAWERERRQRPGSLLVRSVLLAARPHVWHEAVRARSATARRSGAPARTPAGPFTWLDWFAVSRGSRGSGIGQALFSQLEVRSRACGRDALRLDVFKRSRRAQAFFVRHGCLLEGESRYVVKYVKLLPRETAVKQGVPRGVTTE
jgi:ribosomal protein S18 acetylase RimI-like enzyme